MLITRTSRDIRKVTSSRVPRLPSSFIRIYRYRYLAPIVIIYIGYTESLVWEITENRHISYRISTLQFVSMPKSVKSSSITLNAMSRYDQVAYTHPMSYYHHQYFIYICHNISRATNELCRIVVLLVYMSLSFAARLLMLKLVENLVRWTALTTSATSSMKYAHIYNSLSPY